jgi:hypothetical protein
MFSFRLGSNVSKLSIVTLSTAQLSGGEKVCCFLAGALAIFFGELSIRNHLRADFIRYQSYQACGLNYLFFSTINPLNFFISALIQLSWRLSIAANNRQSVFDFLSIFAF